MIATYSAQVLFQFFQYYLVLKFLVLLALSTFSTIQYYFSDYVQPTPFKDAGFSFDSIQTICRLLIQKKCNKSSSLVQVTHMLEPFHHSSLQQSNPGLKEISSYSSRFLKCEKTYSTFCIFTGSTIFTGNTTHVSIYVLLIDLLVTQNYLFIFKYP